MNQKSSFIQIFKSVQRLLTSDKLFNRLEDGHDLTAYLLWWWADVADKPFTSDLFCTD